MGSHVRVLVGMLLSYAWMSTVQAQSQSWSLAQCVSYALEHSFSLRSARIEEEVAAKRRKEITAAGLPQVTANGSFDNNIRIPVSPLPAIFLNPNAEPGTFVTVQFGSRYAAAGSIQVDQLIYQGAYWVGLKAAKVSQRYYNLNTRQAIETVVYNVSRAYCQALIAARQTEIQQTQLATTRELLAAAELRFRQGTLLKTQRDQIQVNQNNLQSAIRTSQRTAERALNQLKYEMGMPLTTAIALLAADPALNAAESVDTTGAVTYGNRVDYKLLQTQDELLLLDIRKGVAGYQPVLTAYGRHQYQAYRQEFDFFGSGQSWPNSQIIGLRLSIPIFDGFQKQAIIQQARLNRESNQLRLRQLEQGVALEVLNARADYLTALQSLTLEEQNITLAEEVYRQANLQYQQGVGLYSDLVNAENAWREAQTNYTNSLLNGYLARLELVRAQGKILELVK